MRFMDFSSWQGILGTLTGLVLVTMIGMGIRVLMMLTIQQRQQRMNRQINERLRSLIAAYKVLGGSFTGRLTVDPSHLKDVKERGEEDGGPMAERTRRMRDAVEASLADILLLGTEEHVRLAAAAARDMAAGTPIHTAELVISLRNYIRKALDLDEIDVEVGIPLQGPTRPQSSSSRGGREGGGTGGGGGAMGGGMGVGMGLGLGSRREES